MLRKLFLNKLLQWCATGFPIAVDQNAICRHHGVFALSSLTGFCFEFVEPKLAGRTETEADKTRWRGNAGRASWSWWSKPQAHSGTNKRSGGGFGFKAVIEAAIPNSDAGVDVLLQKGNYSVACEISASGAAHKPLRRPRPQLHKLKPAKKR